MERKKLAPNSFQRRVVDFLVENAPKSFTGREILEEINKKIDQPKSDGSMSGTLAVLCKDGWVTKSDDYPTKYSYRSEHSGSQPVTRASSAEKQSNFDITQAHSLQSKINRKISDIENSIAKINSQIDQLQKEKAVLQGQLQLAKELLVQDK